VALPAVLEYLAASPARIVLVNLEDLWLETEPQNVPGTTTERPNWRRRARFGLDDIRGDVHVNRVLQRIAQLRRNATAHA
jgi:4-alpha-glucanotransferase